MKNKLRAAGVFLVFFCGFSVVEAMDPIEAKMQLIQAEVENLENTEMDSKLTPQMMGKIKSNNKNYKPMSLEREKKLKAWNRYDLKTTKEVLRDISAQKQFSGVPGRQSSFQQGPGSGMDIKFWHSYEELEQHRGEKTIGVFGSKIFKDTYDLNDAKKLKATPGFKIIGKFISFPREELRSLIETGIFGDTIIIVKKRDRVSYTPEKQYMLEKFDGELDDAQKNIIYDAYIAAVNLNEAGNIARVDGICDEIILSNDENSGIVEMIKKLTGKTDLRLAIEEFRKILKLNSGYLWLGQKGKSFDRKKLDEQLNKSEEKPKGLSLRERMLKQLQG